MTESKRQNPVGHVLRFIAALLLLPGNVFNGKIGLSEEDCGVFRSMFNMLFWGLIVVIIVLVVQ